MDSHFQDKRHPFPLFLGVSQDLPLTNTQKSLKLVLWFVLFFPPSSLSVYSYLTWKAAGSMKALSLTFETMRYVLGV